MAEAKPAKPAADKPVKPNSLGLVVSELPPAQRKAMGVEYGLVVEKADPSRTPLRPGDDLTLDVEVAEARVSNSRPDTGIVTFKGTIRNAAGVVLCQMESPNIVRRRAETGAA